MKIFMKFALALCAATALATAVTAQTAPTINFDSAPNALTLPDDFYLGEVGGVATNSRGDIFVYTRTGHPTTSMASARPFVHGGSRLFQFDRSGKFTREIGQGVYGFLFAAQVRVDPQDNLWVVDEYSSMVMKFDPQGRVALSSDANRVDSESRPHWRTRREGGRGTKPAARRRSSRRPRWRAPEPARRRTSSIVRPTSRGTHRATSSSPTAGNARREVLEGRVFVKSWGQRGNAAGQFASVDSIAVDAQGNATPPMAATSAFRCSTTTARSRPRSRVSATRRRSA